MDNNQTEMTVGALMDRLSRCDRNAKIEIALRPYTSNRPLAHLCIPDTIKSGSSYQTYIFSAQDRVIIEPYMPKGLILSKRK